MTTVRLADLEQFRLIKAKLLELKDQSAAALEKCPIGAMELDRIIALCDEEPEATIFGLMPYVLAVLTERCVAAFRESGYLTIAIEIKGCVVSALGKPDQLN